ncbi:hypothetical protein LWI29_024151 [Acer saccharum]|uniref:Uncharacterized protein n=1 Tax=Acer saccharum TaxID=4024 RepID=A0AA39VNS3_ACESA|nr:hypothetical protein LWI29_024151 [Acer saccharum]
MKKTNGESAKSETGDTFHGTVHAILFTGTIYTGTVHTVLFMDTIPRGGGWVVWLLMGILVEREAFGFGGVVVDGVGLGSHRSRELAVDGVEVGW